MLFDTHIHLDRFPPEIDLEKELAAAASAGIKSFLVPGVHRQGWRDIRRIAESTKGALAAYGLHPLAAAEWDNSCADELRNYLDDPLTVAVGEIGLDRTVGIPVDLQEKVLREQVQIAVERSRPLLIHCRKMPSRLLEIVSDEKGQQVGGIMHAFSGSWQTAQAAIDLGFVLSFGGTLTYPEARRSLEVLKRAPDDAIVIETDAPDMSPHPHRGQVNRPIWLQLVLARLAEIKGWSAAEAAEMTTRNARRVLKIEE